MNSRPHELESLAPGIEIGIGLAEEKPIHVLCREEGKAHVLPRLFDIGDLPLRFYKGEDDLRARLLEIRF